MVGHAELLWAAFLAAGVPHAGVPWPVRVVVGLLGLLGLLAGGRLGRDGLRLVLTALGGVLGVVLVSLAVTVPNTGAAWTLGGGVAMVAGALLLVERVSWRLALALGGFVAGACLGQVVLPEGIVPVVIAATFALVAPWVYEPATRFVSPLLAVPAIFWATGSFGGIVLWVALVGVGITVQLFSGPAHVDLRPIPDAPDWRRAAARR